MILKLELFTTQMRIYQEQKSRYVAAQKLRDLCKNPDYRKRISTATKVGMQDSEVRNKVLFHNRVHGLARMGKPMETSESAKGPKHHKSLQGYIRSPRNDVYYVSNVSHFVRTNSNLFHSDDVIWVKGKSSWTCRASKGLLGIFPCKKDGTPKRWIIPSWKGWLFISNMEQELGGHDLISRKAV